MLSSSKTQKKKLDEDWLGHTRNNLETLETSSMHNSNMTSTLYWWWSILDELYSKKIVWK
jgi:hypothetical protein